MAPESTQEAGRVGGDQLQHEYSDEEDSETLVAQGESSGDVQSERLCAQALADPFPWCGGVQQQHQCTTIFELCKQGEST